MRLWTGMLLAVSLLAFSGCYSVSVRPKYHRYEADFEVKPSILGVGQGKRDQEMEFRTGGIQIAFMPNQDIECFFDLMGAEVENDDQLVDLDEGGELAFGIRAPWPYEPGWGFNFESRLSVHGFDDDVYILGIKNDQTLYGTAVDVRLGAYHALPLGEDGYFFSPHAGGLLRQVEGEEEKEILGVKVADAEYELTSVGIHAGFRINAPQSRSFEMLADFYVATEEMSGFLIALGWRF